MTAKVARWRGADPQWGGREKNTIKVPVEDMEQERFQSETHKSELPDNSDGEYVETASTIVDSPEDEPPLNSHVEDPDTGAPTVPDFAQGDPRRQQPAVELDRQLIELRDRLSQREDELSRCKNELTQCRTELAHCHERLDRVDSHVRHLRELDCSIQNEQRAQTEVSLRENAERYREFRDLMNEKALAWQTNIYGRIKELEQKIEELANLREDLRQTVGSWRTEMFAGNFEGIGYCYRNLCSLLDKIDADNALRASRNEEIFPESEQLRKWKSKFERALTGLGLEIISPHAGDKFDSDLHILACESETEGIDPDSEDLRVSRCVAPGIGYRYNDSFVVIVQPIVTAEHH